MTHIFISYSKKDTRELALNLANALNRIEGITAWVDRSLRAGRSWELQIQTEIDRCDTMIVLYSPDINRHKHGEPESYVLTEIAYAKWTAKKRIIPIMAQATAPPITLTMEHYIDFTHNGLTLDDLVAAICDELEVAPTPPTPPADPTQAAIARARAFAGTRNRDWQPYITTFPNCPIPDMPFCLVPVGSFMMGSEGDYWKDEAPIHSQRIEEPYWIAQYPVTNGQWAQAVKAGALYPPDSVGSSREWYEDPAMRDAPVVGVNRYWACYFAAWMGCRLPTEREWEYAARGVESWMYPWGEVWDSDIPIWARNSGDKPVSVLTKPEGKSWVGAAHLSGNVSEWTNSLYRPYPYLAEDGREQDTDSNSDEWVLRGGSWRGTDLPLVRAVARREATRSNYNVDWGFRLARSV